MAKKVVLNWNSDKQRFEKHTPNDDEFVGYTLSAGLRGNAHVVSADGLSYEQVEYKEGEFKGGYWGGSDRGQGDIVGSPWLPNPPVYNESPNPGDVWIGKPYGFISSETYQFWNMMTYGPSPSSLYGDWDTDWDSIGGHEGDEDSVPSEADSVDNEPQNHVCLADNFVPPGVEPVEDDEKCDEESNQALINAGMAPPGTANQALQSPWVKRQSDLDEKGYIKPGDQFIKCLESQNNPAYAEPKGEYWYFKYVGKFWNFDNKSDDPSWAPNLGKWLNTNGSWVTAPFSGPCECSPIES